jgi:hypothetical protein
MKNVGLPRSLGVEEKKFEIKRKVREPGENSSTR